MAAIPAICDKCHAVFDSGFSGGGGSTVLMRGCRSGPCPECGAMGSVPDGTYSLNETLIRFLSGPRSSYQRLAYVAETIRRMQAEDASADEILLEVSRTSPALAWFGVFLGKPSIHVYFSTLLSVAALLQNCDQTSEIQEAVRRGVIDGMKEHAASQVASSHPSSDKIKVPKRKDENHNAAGSNDGTSEPSDENENRKGNRGSDYI